MLNQLYKAEIINSDYILKPATLLILRAKKKEIKTTIYRRYSNRKIYMGL